MHSFVTLLAFSGQNLYLHYKQKNFQELNGNFTLIQLFESMAVTTFLNIILLLIPCKLITNSFNKHMTQFYEKMIANNVC